MIYLYPYENIIQYKIKEEIHEIELSTKSMEYGKIKNIPIFETELRQILKRKKWISFLQSKSITLILPLDYNEKEKEVFVVILENIGFKNIKITKQRVKIKKNGILLEIHHHYLNKIYLNKNKMICERYPYYIFHNTENTLHYITHDHGKKKRFYLFGSNPKIPHLVFELDNKNVFYYHNYKEYIINLSSP